MDDPAGVRLRANLPEIDLEELGSALGREPLACPVELRGVLLGMLVCAPWPGELYTTGERTLLAHLTHEVSASLHAMYMIQTHTFLEEVADGTRRSAESTRSAAQPLMRMAPAA